ncbi:MAG: hypothetical protein AAFV72_13440 [Cyanobacteria bacterium J06635_1]
MLTIPVFDEIDGITIFRDDTDNSRFYYLPKDLRIAEDINKKKQFTFLRFQFPLNREGEEPGGGYIVFTTDLKAPQKTLDEKVLPRLRQLIRQENPLSTQIPEPKLAPVDFTDGTVELIIMRDNNFIKAINLGKPSLFSDNRASIAIELKADAATLFYEALKQGGSIGAIQYNLRFPVRLPAVTIIGEVNSHEVKEAVMEYTEQTITDGSVWGDDSREERQRTSIAETMESQSLIKLEILKGNVDLRQEDMESLRAFAFRAMDEFIQKHFLKGGSIETEEDRRSQWMEFISADINKNFNLNVSYRDVIYRDYNPNAQINPSFLGGPIDDVILEIDLQNAPWYYNTLEVSVDTTLDFAKYGDIVHSVVGHLSYDEVKPDGTRITARESVVFTADNHTRQEKAFKTRLASVGKDTYQVEVEVHYKAGPVTKQTLAKYSTRVRDLTLEVPNPGVIEVTFAAQPEAFDNELKGIEVEIEYSDPRNKVPLTIESVQLNAQTPSIDYRRNIFAVWDKPYRYRWTYLLDDGQGDAQRSTTNWVASQARTVSIPTAFDQNLSVNIIASVDWSEVAQMVVDLDYEDTESDYRRATSLSFQADTNQLLPWQVPLRNEDRRDYRYRQTLLFKNSAFRQEEWQKTHGETLIAGNAPGGVVKLEVDPFDADIGGAVRRAIVSLTYVDETHDVVDTARFLFRDNTPQIWSIARQDAHVSDYLYAVDYFMADGTRKQLVNQNGVIQSDQDFLFLPASNAADPA